MTTIVPFNTDFIPKAGTAGWNSTDEWSEERPHTYAYLDPFDSGLRNYIFYRGASNNLNTTTGALACNGSTTTVNAFYLALGWKYQQPRVEVQFTTGASTTNFVAGVIAKGGVSSYLYAKVSGTSLQIWKFESATDTLLSTTTTIPALLPNTTYWLTLMVNVSAVTARWYVGTRPINGTPAGTVTYTLTSTDATNYGSTSLGYSGVHWVAGDPAARVNSFAATSYLPQGSTSLGTVNSAHINIRSFFQTQVTIPTTQAKILGFEQWQDGTQQIITFSGAPASGTFTLSFYDDEAQTTRSKIFNWNDRGSVIKAWLETFVGVGTVSITELGVGPVYAPYAIVFQPVKTFPLLLAHSNLLTGASAPVTVTCALQTSDANWLQSADPTDPTRTQAQMMSTTYTIGENWLISGDVNYSQTDLVVDRDASYNNLRTLKVPLKNGAFNFFVTSNVYNKPVNLLYCNPTLDPTTTSLFLIFYGALPASIDATNSYLQLTSHPTGQFGTAYDSNTSNFTSLTSLDSNASFFKSVSLSTFTTSTSFDPTRVTAVRFHCKGTAVTNDVIRIAGLLSKTATLNSTATSYDTSRRIFGGAPTFSLPIARATASSAPVCLRGPVASPPTANDVTTSLTFNTGKLLDTDLTNDAVQSFHRVRTEVVNGVNVKSAIVVTLVFNHTSAYILRTKVGRVMDAGTDSNNFIAMSRTYVDALPGALLADTNYSLTTNVVADSVQAILYKLDSGGLTTATVYATDETVDTDFTRGAGQVGFWLQNILDKDLYLSSFHVESVSFATFRSATFASHTPVDGAQLVVDSSADEELWSSFTSLQSSDTVLIDAQRSLSGSAYKVIGSGLNFYGGLRTNQLEISDWVHGTMSFDIWTPQELLANADDGVRPQVYFAVPGTFPGDFTTVIGPIPLNLAPNAWATNSFDLGFLRSQPTGTWEMWIMTQSKNTYTWWVDNVSIRRRTVLWEFRAQNNGRWVSFKDQINSSTRGAHVPPELRGKELQIQARALQPGAWISSYTLYPHYANLGKLNPGIVVQKVDAGTVTSHALIGTIDNGAWSNYGKIVVDPSKYLTTTRAGLGTITTKQDVYSVDGDPRNILSDGTIVNVDVNGTAVVGSATATATNWILGLPRIPPADRVQIVSVAQIGGNSSHSALTLDAGTTTSAAAISSYELFTP